MDIDGKAVTPALRPLREAPEGPTDPIVAEMNAQFLEAIEVAKAWRNLVFDIARELGCLASASVDGNGHVLAKAKKLNQPPRAVSENTFGGIRFVVDPHVPPGEVQLRQDGRIVARFVAGCDGEIITGSPVTPPDCTLRNPEPPGMTP